MKKKKKSIIVGVVFFAVFFACSIYGSTLQNDLEAESKTYKEFLVMVEEGNVSKTIFTKDSQTFVFADNNDNYYETLNPFSQGFREFLLENEIDIVINEPFSVTPFFRFSGGLLRVFVILIALKFLLSMSNIGRGDLEDKIKALEGKDTEKKEVPSTKFSDIAGNEEAKEDMQFLVNFLKHPLKYAKIGAKLPKGVVLYGPPGTGKTLTARAIAGEAGVPFINVNGSDFMEMYVGVGAKRVRKLFKEAREKAPCIVFIDEIDAIGSKRGSDFSSSEKDQTINALLSELDGFSSNEPIITIIATNRLEVLDPALIRPGRFDRHIAIELPDKEAREDILRSYIKKKRTEESVEENIKELAKMTIGFSGAEIEALINEASIIAVNNDKEKMTNEDIEESFFRMVMKGYKKKNKEKDSEELELIAYHEAGHALLTKILTKNEINKVTIIPTTSGAGGVAISTPDKEGLLTKEALINRVKVLYGGRAAEELLRGPLNVTTGASNDIREATRILRAYFCDLGMSEEIGMLAISNDKKIEKEMAQMSKDIYRETINLLDKNKELLKKIAEELLSKETIIDTDIEILLKEKPPVV